MSEMCEQIVNDREMKLELASEALGEADQNRGHFS